MKKKIKYIIWKIFKKIGIELLPDEKKNSIQSYLFELFKRNRINLVLDVGSNVGQFYNLLRNIGYVGNIELFEPLHECHEILTKITRNDKNANLNPFALGDKQEIIPFYVTNNNVSSSLLLPNDSSKIIRSYEIDVRKLDDLEIDLLNYNAILLKIDAQGYEKNVILGAIKKLKFITHILMELSLTSQYVGEMELVPMFEFMQELGYKPIFIYPGVTNKLNEVLQYEVVFKKVS